MASEAPRFILSVLYFIFATGITLALARNSLNDILSLVSNGQNRRPVFLIVDSKAPSHSHHFTVSHSSSEEDLTRSGLMKLLRQISQPRSNSQSSHFNRGHFRSRVKNLLRGGEISDVPQSGSSDIIKDLLILRNSLRCKQQYDCKNKCMENPKYQNNICNNVCEKKYQCGTDDPEEYDCAVDDDTCTIDENPSTRGISDNFAFKK